MRRKDLPVIITGALLVGLVLVSSYVGSTVARKKTTTQTGKQQLPGMQTGNAPWSAELQHLRGRLNAMGLPTLADEGTMVHLHQHLDIYIKGKHLTVPGDIGRHEEEGFIAQLHTHNETGIMHV